MQKIRLYVKHRKIITVDFQLYWSFFCPNEIPWKLREIGKHLSYSYSSLLHSLLTPTVSLPPLLIPVGSLHFLAVVLLVTTYWNISGPFQAPIFQPPSPHIPDSFYPETLSSTEDLGISCLCSLFSQWGQLIFFLE